ncbi:MAG: DMT family transporter [Gammaproteobacteria bacterium]|nr:DMT family transporter [Gammaproteobacteria bacterium]
MQNHLPLGVLLSLLGAFFYAAQTGVIKLGVGHLPPLPVIVFVQSAVALILMLPVIFRKGFSDARDIFVVKRFPLHVVRAIFSLLISYALFYAVAFIPLVNAMLLVNTAPLIVPLLGRIFLGEKINHRLWLPILIGFIGVVLVLHPGTHFFNIAALFALAAAFCMSASLLSVRQLSKTDSPKKIAFWFFLLSTIISGAVALFFWMPISLKALGLMSVVGVFYFLTQYTMASALKYANAQLVGSLFYATIIFAAIFSFIFAHILPSGLTLCGMMLVILGGIACVLTERRTLKKSAVKKEQTGYVYEN